MYTGDGIKLWTCDEGNIGFYWVFYGFPVTILTESELRGQYCCQRPINTNIHSHQRSITVLLFDYCYPLLGNDKKLKFRPS